MINSNSSRIEPDWQEVMDFNANLSCTILGIVFNLITIFVINRIGPKMNRTDKMIVVLSINNFLFLLSSIVKQYVLRNIGSFRKTVCFAMNVEVTLFMACAITVLCLLSNRIMTNIHNIDAILLCILYGFILLSFVLQAIFCIARFGNDIYELLTLTVLFLSFGVLIRNELSFGWKCYQRIAPCSSAPLRLNIARIFIYNTFISLILFYLLYPSPTNVFLCFNFYFTSLYIMIYLICAYKNFRICLLQSLQCRSTQTTNHPPVENIDEEDQM